MNMESVLQRFKSVSLDELNILNFTDRQDSKSVFHVSLLPQFLEKLSVCYRILEMNATRQFRYHTVYFDTPEFSLYHDHQRGKANRQKIRFRKYADTGAAFFEIKSKNNKGRNRKLRIPVEDIRETLTHDLKEFVRAHATVEPEALAPTLSVFLNRVSLVHADGSEKVTFDTDIQFKFNGMSKNMDGLVIAEVKQKKLNPESDFLKIQRSLGVRPAPVSKYCLGIASLNNAVKTNRFKAGLLQMEKITAE